MPAPPRNRLGDATSPYLLQHADNPVHWWPWCPEAFQEAAALDRPILLSVGYAACHWCHVMAHESFEDPATADMMNRSFVNVKVDREERPDVDRVYMDAVQAATGRGGWPMTVFLTPAGEPFYAGTYFPKEDRAGLPGFGRVLDAVTDAWANRRGEIQEQAGKVTAVVRASPPASAEPAGEDALRAAYRTLEDTYDPVHGGFGRAPKFPQAPILELLLRIAGEDWAPRAAEMLEHTLSSMAAGGIHDQLGGGFARYSVDEAWLVPHFEKMLYDNALLARLYLRAAQVTGNGTFTAVARSTLDYLLGDLRLPEGGFASSEDADSQGAEGRFYVFSLDEFRAAVGDDPEVAAAFGVTADGNFEGSNVLHRPTPGPAERVEDARRRLRGARDRRVRPARDDKAVCAWNALTIRALAEAGAVLGDDRYLAAAEDGADFILTSLRDADGRLRRSWRDGRASGPGFADDYGATATALLTLYQATGETRWYREGAAVADAMIDRFWDDAEGGVFATGRDAERLIARPKNLFDNPTPSDNSLAAEALSMLAAATGQAGLDGRIDEIAGAAGTVVERVPWAAGYLLAVLFSRNRRRELAVIGEPGDPRTRVLAAVAHERFHPEVFLATGPPGDDSAVPLLAGRPPGPSGEPMAYLCTGFTCDAPTPDPEALRRSLG